MDQWSLYIDIEGFSATYAKGSESINVLGALMEALYWIGSRCYPDTPHRLFAHQLGDGFVVVGEFECSTQQQPISVAIGLLRAVLSAGGVAKAAISWGQFADVVFCYPKIIQELYAKSHGGAIPMGKGLMTILPVMGTALIGAYGLLHSPAAPSGALLLLKRGEENNLPTGTVKASYGDLIIIDWVHTSFVGLDGLMQGAQIPIQTVECMEVQLRKYIVSNSLHDKWLENTTKYLHLGPGI